jgi:hypothetical protein
MRLANGELVGKDKPLDNHCCCPACTAGRYTHNQATLARMLIASPGGTPQACVTFLQQVIACYDRTAK